MGFWLAAAGCFLLPSALAAYLLPQELLGLLANQARWGGPLWFGVLAALVGVLRQRLQGLFELAVEGDDWRFVQKRLRAAERIQKRLDALLAVSLALGLTAFFVPVLVAILPTWLKHLLAATPIGSAAFVLWVFFVWSKWRASIDEARIDLGVRRREREQRKEQLERLRKSRLATQPQAPKVIQGVPSRDDGPPSH
ncbi:hypothetical protein [Alkalilimnicola sp. S0819]|uniref:hypothetical protein n=1 Tax=Alkalilimnicola sp. S0819 TaxID=2613922 RepID=UPI001262ABC3|nr:hypothetical protein [Alkalilimnicola sp. S0819]KAB7624330.1 hypothetical protein F3N43_05850 [Alkalilimnicola sp. S0819]MPQ16155.1 hypothetical protein [Alkalilimnicola sp. S0819]